MANVFGIPLWGLPAGIVWAFIHLMHIVEFQSRIVVFMKWAIQDVTFSRGSRLITGAAFTDFNFNHAVAGQIAVQPTVEKKSEPAIA